MPTFTRPNKLKPLPLEPKKLSLDKQRQSILHTYTHDLISYPFPLDTINSDAMGHNFSGRKKNRSFLNNSPFHENQRSYTDEREQKEGIQRILRQNYQKSQLVDEPSTSYRNRVSLNKTDQGRAIETTGFSRADHVFMRKRKQKQLTVFNNSGSQTYQMWFAMDKGQQWS